MLVSIGRSDYGGRDLVDRVRARSVCQVFLNVLRNAAEAIDGAGEIRIRSAQVNDRVAGEIADAGCGIEPERLHLSFTSRRDVILARATPDLHQ